MKRVNILGKTYELLPDTLRKYDGYYYDGEVLDRAPVNSKIVGYVVEEKQKIAICKRVRKELYPVLYAVVGLAGIVTLSLCVAVILFDVEVPHWTIEQNGDDVVGVLDDGVTRTSRTFAYSEYVTYDGENVLLFLDSKNKDAEIAVTAGGITSTYLPVTEAFSVPIQLSINEQEITQGILHLKVGEEITDYPLVIEYLASNTPTLSVGNISDNIEANRQYEEGVPGQSMLLEETKDKNDYKTYEDSNSNFESFNKITYKNPDEPLEGESEDESNE